jgi:hypothetical protein
MHDGNPSSPGGVDINTIRADVALMQFLRAL